MRWLLVALPFALLLAACSASTPRHPAVAPSSAAVTAPVPKSSATAASTTAPVSAQGTPVWTETCQPTTPSSDTSTWATVAPAGKGFSMRMPGQPLYGTGIVTTPIGDAQYAQWTYFDGCIREYTLSITTFARGQLTGPPQTILDGISAAQPGSMSGSRLAGQSHIEVNGHAGRRFTLTTDDGATRLGEFVVSAQTVFTVTLTYWGAGNDPPAGVAEAFLASFDLTV